MPKTLSFLLFCLLSVEAFSHQNPKGPICFQALSKQKTSFSARQLIEELIAKQLNGAVDSAYLKKIETCPEELKITEVFIVTLMRQSVGNFSFR